MSAEVVNLRRARKTRLRAAKEADAATNRAKFGRTQSVRQAEAEAAARAERHLDGHRLGHDLGHDREETPGPAPRTPARDDDRLP